MFWKYSSSPGEHMKNDRYIRTLRSYSFLNLLGITLLLLSSSGYSADAQEETQYVRFIEGTSQWQGELQTAIVSFENDAGVKLNLVAAVHLGEEEYYAALNEYFTTQDVVLYELVAEANQIPVQGATGSTSLIGYMQQSLARFLNVGFQLNEIDYSPSNFLHADLTPSQLEALMASKDENFLSMFLSLAMAQMAEQSVVSEESTSSLSMLSLLGALKSQNQNNAFKYLFAAELGRSGGVIVGAELEQQLTILGDRNKAALRVLDEVLQNPSLEQVSIFYGAAHMPGFEREITSALGFSRSGLSWQSAWIVP